jgi:hypothetical protein
MLFVLVRIFFSLSFWGFLASTTLWQNDVSAVHDYVLTPAKFIGGGLNVLHPTLSFSSETSCPPTLSFSSETSCPPTLPFFSEENDNQGGALGHGCG